MGGVKSQYKILARNLERQERPRYRWKDNNEINTGEIGM
jgi:hypothetical protein